MDYANAEEFLTASGIASDDEISLVTTINGSSIETLQDILFVRTGYRTFEQLTEE